MYRPGTWGNRFAALDPCPPPSNSLQEETPAPAASGQGKESGATAAGAAPARLQQNPAHAAPVATTVAADAAPTPAAREYAEADQEIGRAKRELCLAEEAKAANRKALEGERTAKGRWAESLAQRRVDLAAIREQLAARNHAVPEAEGALSGAAESYDSAHHAFVTERDRALNLKRFTPHMRTVREAARITMIAENARLLPARDPPPAFDSANPALRVVPAGRAATAAPRTEPPIVDGGDRVAYDPARPGLQEGHPGPAAVPSPAAAAAVLPPAAPALPLTTPALPPAAPVLPPAAPVLPPTAPVFSLFAPALPPAPALQAAAVALAAYDSGRLTAFLAMRAVHPEVSDAVLLAFQAAEYRAAGQGGSPRGGPGGGGHTYGSGSHYGPGGGDEHQYTQQPAQHQQLQYWQGNRGGGSSGGWAGGRGSRHRRYGRGAHDSEGEGLVPITRNDLPDPARQHDNPSYTHDTTHQVAAAPRPDAGDVDRQVEELSRTPDRPVIQRAFTSLRDSKLAHSLRVRPSLLLHTTTCLT